MRRIILSILTLLLVTGTGSVLMARGLNGYHGAHYNKGCQGYGMNFGGGPGYHGMMYDELNLTDEQEEKIHTINKNYADKFFETKKAMDKVRESYIKDLEKVLTKEQIEKAKDFSRPVRGDNKRMYKGIHKPGRMHDLLNITEDQAEKIHNLNMDYQNKLFQNRNNPDEIEKLRENHRKDFEKILTKDQLDNLKNFQKNHREKGFGPGFGWMW